MCLQIALYPPDRMFSSNFLGGGNPLSAMSSAVNKFSLFGDETEDGKEKQQKGSLKQKIPEQHGNGQPMSHGSQNHSTEKSPGGRMGDAHLQGIGRGLPQSPASERGSPQQQRAGRGGPHHQGMGRGKSPQHETGKGGPPHHATTGPGTRQGETATASLCPICKNTKLNFQSKEPPNHNTCTKCKSVVCSMCGFSPPDATAKEWLCLNCQMQRALGVEEAPIPFISSKTPTPSPSPVKQSSSTVQKKGTAQNQSLHPTSSEQSKPPEGHKPPGQESSITAKEAMSTLHPQPKPTQQEKGKDSPSPAKSEPPTQPAPKEQSGFFGFRSGGARSRSPSPQPSGSAVSGKVLGFGSSLFSSASNLISSAVQDESSAMQPTSRKASSVSQTSDRSTPPASRKGSEASKDSPKLPATPKQEQKKPEVTQPTKATVDSTKEKLTSSQSPKASQKTLPKSCPICKVDLQKEPPNYNTCTECKTIVCNQCGFNPMPHQSEITEWLCLNCHTRRASGLSSMQSNKIPPTASPQNKKTSVSEQPYKKKDLPDKTILKGLTTAEVKQKEKISAAAAEKQVNQQQSAHRDEEKSQMASKVEPSPAMDKPSQENSGLFGIGGARSRSPSPQPSVSAVTGKVLGFGSSFFSSASNLISSAVQDEASTTPPTSRKDSSVSQSSIRSNTPPSSSRKGSSVTIPQGDSQKKQTDTNKSPIIEKKEEKKPDVTKHQGKDLPNPDKSKLEPTKVKESSHILPKNCPLCKVKIKKDASNYNTCTNCRNIVCIQCGFNPSPHQTERMEWLCLTCQMQQATGAPQQPQPQASKVPVSVSKQNKEPLIPAKDKKSLADGKLHDNQSEAEKKQDSSTIKHTVQSQHPKQQTQQTKDGLSKPAKSEPPKKESDFFGFGRRSRSPSPQPAHSGKVLGFGSSIFSAASNLLSSAVQDGTTPTPSTSRKGSTVSQTSENAVPTVPDSSKRSEVSNTIPASSKVSSQDSTKENSSNVTKLPTKHDEERKIQEMKSEVESSKSVLAPILKDTTPSDATKTTETTQLLPKVCPLCKVEIKKEPPNYSICTECKNAVCNLCGFNPMPDKTEMKEWLCLNCQIQRTSGSLKPTQTKPINVPMPASPKKDVQAKVSLQNLSPKQGSKGDTSAKPVLSQTETIRDKSGFGLTHDQSPQPATIKEKGLGFGSSIISTASDLISSAVQDKTSITAPNSHKSSAVSEESVKASTPPASCKVPVVSKKDLHPNETKSISQKPGSEEKMSALQTSKEESVEVKEGVSLSACPLCKEKFQNNPPNFSTCTSCKMTVCNFCGFNPMPDQTEVKEWLCLNCQMQQLSGASPAQTQAKNILPLEPEESPVASQKKSIIPVDVTDKNKILSEVGKSEDQPLVPASQNPTTPAKFPQPSKDEPLKDDTVSAISQTSAKAASVLPASVETLISGKTKSQTVQKQKEIKPADQAPNAQSAKAPSALEKGEISLSKLQKDCPICNEKLKKDPTNYNTCDSCKAIVCNLCGGMNSRADITEKNWLCVNCQKQQAPGPPPAKAKEESLTELEKSTSSPGPTKKKTSIPVGDTESDQIPTENVKPHDKLTPEKTQKATTSVAEPKPSLVDSVELQSAVPSEKQSGIFGFSFGGTKSQPPSQPAASAVSGRVLGFGSSFLSSASNLISSAVQDEPSITPPTSRKGSTISLKNASTPPFSRKSSAAQQHEEKKETENKLQDQLAKETPPLLKKETACLELYKACPLCKADLKNDPPNYNTCTQCKNIVCNLCGFSPIPQETEETTSFMDQQVSEWLCLSCQIQRAPGPPPAKTQSEVKKVPSPVLPKKKETPAAGSPLKNPSLPVNAKDEKPSGVIKPVDKPITAETQEPPAPSTQPSTAKSAPPQKVEPTKEESSLFGFSFSGTRSRPASPQPGISAVSGKVLGFGSSFLSSASNLISSAVQHEPSTTPPTSRKGSTTSQTSVKMTSSPSTSHKKQVEKIESETNVEVQLPKADTPLSESLGTCTICKADLKIDPPNYTTCTECKKTVCNLCGFSPVPQETKVKKWLCLDCHKQHAPRPPPILPQLEANNLPSPAPKQEGQTTDDPQTEPSLSVDATMKAAENVKKDDKSSRAESQTPTAVQSAQQSSPDTPAIPKKPESSNKEKSFFSFSTGGDKSPAPQPDISAVSGKTRGFGASFFSSASNLISSARQDEPSTTPPTSRKGSTISQQSEKDTPTAHTLDKESKEQKEEGKTALKMTSDDKTAVPPSIVEKDEHLNKPLKACPLCKVALTKDPPNCDTCTECKAIVCHLCGFSPILQQTQVKEWLCLNCQIQRAPGAPSTQPQQQANKVPPPASPQQKAKYLAGNPEDKPTQVETKKTISTPTKQQSTAPTTKGDPSKKESGFFGFGGARSRSPSPQPAVSAVSGKVLGFGSSLFSTASNIISSAVHDEPTTPPTPRKGSATSQTSVKSIPVTPTSSQKEPVEPEKHHTKKTTKEERPVAEKHENKLNEKQIKTTKVTGESPKVEEPSKHQNVACPLCKIALNVGSTEAPNYNTCTECKDTVCNLCGFNPIPHQSEVYEWLCLNCQTQRTLKGIEPQKPQAKPDIVSTSTLSSSNITPKTATDANETSTKDLCEMQGPHKDVPAATQNKASNLTPVQSDNISNTGTTQVKDIINDKVVKKAQEKETFADTKVGAPTKDMHSSKGTAIIEDQKSAVSQKPGIDQEPTAKPSDNNSEIKSVLEKSEQKQSKSSAPEVEIPKEESGFFGFGFGSGKSQSTPSKPSDTRTGKLFGFGGLTEAPSQQSAPSVSGKVLGFGSSIFSSASNLISSAVNDEPSRTPPSPRKGSTVSQTSIKSATTPSSRKGSTVSQASLKTPPTSRKGSAASETSLKTSPIGDTKPSDSEKQAEKETDDMSKVKLDGASSEPSKPPDLEKHIEKTPDDKSEIKSAPLQSASKMEQSSCPICKVQLNVASEGLPNFNTCTKCNNNVCNQCGFDPMPNQTTVKQWLCMNCQKQRVEGGVEPTGSSVINPHPTLPKKDQQLATSDHKLVETSTVRVDGKTSSIPETAKKGHQKPSLNEDVPPSNKELPQQKAQEQKDEKSQKQMKKGPDSPARSNPPSQTEVPKQQSSFFGFGVSTGKSQPTPSKSSESTTGKLFGFAGLTETARSRSPSPQSMTNAPGKFLGFGSTIFSSASNLISSALQDESSPPLSRKGSTVSQSSTPPTSRKGSIVPTAEPKAPISKKLDDKPVEKKIEEPNETKDKSSVSEKQEAMPESVEVTVLPKSPFKASQPTCPLCKVDLNVGSKELPNYNTCTECKDVVCNLCGFNPMPHLAESKGSQSSTPVGTHKKIKRTLPHPPPDEDTIVGPLGYSTGSSRRRVCRNTTMARAKILQDIDKELDLVERESSKLRKKQAELDEEEKEIDAKLRYLEMGINRRKEALLKEREKRERAYLQGVAEERDYMSDSEVSNNRETRGNGHGLERPRTAPQSEFNQFIPPQTEADSQYAQLAYSHYQYASQSDSPSHYSQQTLYQQPSLYHQHVSPYQTQSIYSSVPTLSQQSQQTGFDHASQLLLMQQKTRQTTLSDLEPKITTNYEVIRNQPLLIAPTSTESAYGVSHLTSKYNNLDLRIGLEERGSMASSPMSSISAESFYADIDHHNVRNYVMIDDIGELTKGSRGLDQSFNVPDKDISKTDRLLRVADVRRTTDVTDFIGPLQASSRLHSYGKPEEDSMEEPYELKLLKQQIKQEFRRGTESLEQLTGLPHYLHSESFRHFPKSEKYSIGRLTLEKQAAKQLSASVLYQKQLKNKRTLIDPKITKFSPIQESRDLEPDYSSFLSSTGSPMGGLSSRARLLQDEITFGLRKNLAEQQKYLGSTLSANLAQSLNLGHSLNLGQSLRSSIQDDGTYPSGTRSRPSSRPSSVYGLDLSIKRDLSSSSLRLKSEGDGIDSQFGIARVKPTSLPISQSRGRIPIVAQNSEEESPLSPVGQPMGMARASAGPLPPISADSRDQFGSSHSLPEVQQHMREESRTRGYDRDIAFIMDDLQGAMSDSEAYHLQHEETDWFDKPREGHSGSKPGQDKRQVKGMHYPFPYTRIKLQRDPKDHSVSGGGFGIHVVGGKEIPGTNGEIGAYIANLAPAGTAELSGKFIEAMEYHKQRAYMKNHIFHL
ncbi:hypothetical protein QTP86_019920 [Hemibagrus guttatus]|nr:hypothetical protein QTP86_019920 [Hemibagrus guttatus]